MAKLRKWLVAKVLKAYVFFTSWIPEGFFKRSVRLFSLRFKHFLFEEFAINKGETYFIVGTPAPNKILKSSKIVGDKGRIVVFEPAPDNLKIHDDIVKEHNLQNVTIVRKAISDHNGKAKFLIAPHDADHKLIMDNIKMDNDYISDDYYIDEIDVDVDTIDNVAEELGVKQIDYIEITINGAEMAALRGMKNSLNITKRAYVKGHAINNETGEPIRIEEEKFLKPYGFKIKITKKSKTSAKTIDWGMRQGDIFAYR